ncbi:helix-turn-helix domain-containing protein [Flavobacteriaceae bacterium]|nr:helix-turn-helix domain-containing protein [Flavobacteriaceae bacterium]
MTNLQINQQSPNQLLSRRQASEYLGVKENTLAIWACNKRYGLPVIKVGRLCKYRLSDLDKFLDERTCAN